MTRLRQDPNTGFYDLPSDFWSLDEVEDEYWTDEPEDEEPEEFE